MPYLYLLGQGSQLPGPNSKNIYLRSKVPFHTLLCASIVLKKYPNNCRVGWSFVNTTFAKYSLTFSPHVVFQ